MTCSYPLMAWQSVDLNANGKSTILFYSPSDRLRSKFKLIALPCGHCISCRLKKSSEWATRGYAELKTVEFGKSYMVTLTYDKEHLPFTPSNTFDEYGDSVPTIVKKDVQDFIKRLRSYCDYHELAPRGHKITYMYCGEYGEKRGRPHYHIIFFGLPIDDFIIDPKTPLRMVRKNYYQYISPTLDKLWTKGRVRSEVACWDNIAYVARYVTKKIYGDMANDHYDGAEPEFFQVSLNPAIGYRWFNKFSSDVYNHDRMFVMRSGKVVPVSIPKYFDKLLEKFDNVLYNKIKEKRKTVQRPFSDEFLHSCCARGVRDERVNSRLIRHYEIGNENIVSV